MGTLELVKARRFTKYSEIIKHCTDLLTKMDSHLKTLNIKNDSRFGHRLSLDSISLILPKENSFGSFAAGQPGADLASFQDFGSGFWQNNGQNKSSNGLYGSSIHSVGIESRRSMLSSRKVDLDFVSGLNSSRVQLRMGVSNDTPSSLHLSSSQRRDSMGSKPKSLFSGFKPGGRGSIDDHINSMSELGEIEQKMLVIKNNSTAIGGAKKNLDFKRFRSENEEPKS